MPAHLTPLVLLGLRVSGYPLLEQQVRDQLVDRIAQVCVADDAVTQEAVHTYLDLLLAVLDRPAMWGINSDDLPRRIERHEAYWYRRTLESVQRQAGARAARAQRERPRGTQEDSVQGTMQPGQTADQPRSSKELAARPIGATLAARLADMLRGAGYDIAAAQVVGRSAAAVAQLCETTNAWPRQLVLLSIYDYLDVQHGQADILTHMLELWRRYLLSDEGDSSSEADAT